MPTIAELRQRYQSLSTPELRELIAGGESSFTVDAWQALNKELSGRPDSAAPFLDEEAAPSLTEQDLDNSEASSSNAAYWERAWSERLQLRHNGRKRLGDPYPKAPAVARTIAYLIDCAIAAAPAFFAGLLLGLETASVLVTLLFALSTLWALYYLLSKDSWRCGQSFGKRATGLMVVQLDDGEPCTLGSSAGRGLVLSVLTRLASLPVENDVLQVLLIVFGLIEPAMAVLSHDGRRLGDLLAGTQVVTARDYLARRNNNDGLSTAH